jgi:predicted phage terminase large subunit-like protein
VSGGEAIHRRLAEIAARELALERQEVDALRVEAAKKAEEKRDAIIARILDRSTPGSLAAFVRYAWPMVEPGRPFLESWHIDVICAAIEEHFDDKESGGELVCCQPPRTMKSYIFNVIFPAWAWIFQPHLQFLSVSNSDNLAMRDSLRMRQIVSHADYKALVKRAGKSWEISKEQAQKTNFENTKKGRRYCTAIGSNLTGEGADWLLLDDLYDVADVIQGSAERIAERMVEIVEIYKMKLKSRLNPGGPKKKMCVMQRLHEGDIAGVLEREGAKTLILPMRYDPLIADPRDKRTVAGEVLVAESWMPVTPLEKWEENLGHQASGQLQQRPVSPTGGLFPVQDWFWQDRRAFPATFEREAAGWDLAFGATESGAYHVGHFGGLKAGKVYLLEEVRGRYSSPDLYENMRAAKKRRPKSIGWYIEDRAAARPAIENLEKEIPGMVRVQPIGDKYARAQSWQPYVKAGNIILPCTCGVMVPHHHENVNTLPGEDWANDLVKEHASFPKGTIKDRVDALGYLVKELIEHKPRKSWGDLTWSATSANT